MLETQTVELKREYTDDIKYTVVAFANTDGGKIYIGLNDDGTVQGVENIDDVMLRVTNMVRDVVRPDVTMFMDCEVQTMDEKYNRSDHPAGYGTSVLSCRQGCAPRRCLCAAGGIFRSGFCNGNSGYDKRNQRRLL